MHVKLWDVMDCDVEPGTWMQNRWTSDGFLRQVSHVPNQ